MGSHTAPDWPFDDEQKLRVLWARGLSAGEIARQIPGRSRNAVIGKAKRLNLEGRASPILPPRPVGAPAPVRKPRAPKVKPEAKAKPPHPGQQGKVAVVLGVTFPPCSPEEADKKRAVFEAQGKAAIKGMDAATNDNAVPLLDRKFGQCAWPVGTPARPAEQMVCAAPVYEGLDGCSYCLPHAQRATTRDITQPRPKENLARSLRRWAA